MVLGFKTGTFVKTSSVTTQSITGVGFQPKMVWLHAVAVTSDAFEAGYNFYFGADDGPTALSLSMNGVSEADPSSIRSGLRGFIWHDHQSDGTFNQIADVSSFDVDGFTLSWNPNDSTNWSIAYLALGGDHLVEVRLGVLSVPATTGNQSYLWGGGGGFRPNLFLLLGLNHQTYPPPSSSQSIASYCLGAVNPDSMESAVIAGTMEDDVHPTQTARYQALGKCLALFSTTDSEVLSHEATLASITNEGFTLNFTTATSSKNRVLDISLLGGDYRIGRFSSPTTGVVRVSQTVNWATAVGKPFTPRGIMILSTGCTEAESGSIVRHMRHSISARDEGGTAWNCWAADRDGITQQTNVVRMDTDGAVIRISTEDPIVSNTATHALADLASIDGNGFTLSWRARDWVPYEGIYIVFADTSPEILAGGIYIKAGKYFQYFSGGQKGALRHGIHTTMGGGL